MYITITRMLRAQRLQQAADIASELIVSVRDRCFKSGTFGCWGFMSKVTLLGFSFGAHVANQICVDLYKKTGQKVGKYVGKTDLTDLKNISHDLMTFNAKVIL